MALKAFIRKARRFGLDGLYRRVDGLNGELRRVEQGLSLQSLKVQIGDLQARAVKAFRNGIPLHEAEFKVFSQFGDDGIIQYIFSRIDPIDYFVEFGVETYEEANTRFLLIHDNWRGLILDANEDLPGILIRQGIPQVYDLTARSSFITPNNIQPLLEEAAVPIEFGMLSIDIDGNDYWVWEAIQDYSPQVVIVEYNAVFGSDRAVSIPHEPSFSRQVAHPSWLYFGASLPALVHLGEKKGYVFAGCNSAGNNAYFIRKDLAHPFHQPSQAEGFVDSRFRESRDQTGNMNCLSGHDRRAAIADMPLIDVISGETLRVRDLP